MSNYAYPPVLRQSELAAYLRHYRITGYPVVCRVLRQQQGGGFGDQDRHPYAWGVWLRVDGVPTRLLSARGQPREWTSLDRLERWLRERGLPYWWVQNDVEEAAGVPMIVPDPALPGGL